MAEKKEKTVKCELMRDYWDDEGRRHTKGTIVTIPMEAAIEGIESGALKRVKAK